MPSSTEEKKRPYIATIATGNTADVHDAAQDAAERLSLELVIYDTTAKIDSLNLLEQSHMILYLCTDCDVETVKNDPSCVYAKSIGRPVLVSGTNITQPLFEEWLKVIDLGQRLTLGVIGDNKKGDNASYRILLNTLTTILRPSS